MTQIKKLFIASLIGIFLVQGIGKAPLAKADIVKDVNGYIDSNTGDIVEDVEDEIRYEKERYYIDDFETIEAYLKYCEENGFTDELISQIWLGGNPSTTISPTLMYQINNLPSTRAIQNFYVGSQYVYVTQHMGNGNVRISRCTITGSGTATYKDYMTLTGVGHGATLERYTYNNKEYFLITAKSNETINGDGNTVYYSLQVGRIEYKANTTLDNLKIARFCNLNYANKANTRFADVERVNAAITTSADKILLWVRSSSNSIQYSVYNFNTFNSELDKVEGNNYLAYFSNNTTMKNSCEYSVVQTSSNCVLPNGSFQGIDIANLGNTGKHAVYIASGNQNNGKELVVARVRYDVGSSLTYMDNVGIALSGGNNEIEGIHVINSSTLYIGVAKHNANGSKINYIYSIPRSSV